MRPRVPRDLWPKQASVYMLALGDEPAAHQLVGRVTAYQGKDG